ncbi:hypothetical protein V9T40_009144 [Parthenolecanium corni]|uniref:Major facilitator superfamily (MFS) profile domain-containing protein n=1 Tax=Parthenolecanium corni TaxID=536013 RepID=A0AAN9U0P3_9HEMI
MFPDNVATVMSTLETFYGLGFIVGPTVGGLLFEVGGFPLPFFFVGIVSGILSILIFTYVPNVAGSGESKSSDGKIFTALKIPSIAIDAVCTATFALSQGFFSSTLEPHLRIFHISAVLVSMMFVINGATYAVASPFVGRLVDKCLKPKYALIISLILNLISFAILGPLPFLPIPQTLTVVMIALFLQGLALAGGNVAGFIDSIRSAVAAGYPADISTYGLMSGIWASAFAFGAFVGPSVAGFLYDIVGFQKATIFVVVINVILLFILSAYLIVTKCAEVEIAENEEIVRKLRESTNSLLKLNVTKDMSIRSSQIITRSQNNSRRTGYVSI